MAPTIEPEVDEVPNLDPRRLCPNAAILNTTMGEYPDFRTPDSDGEHPFADDAVTELSKSEIAHDRGRICKKRGCVVCAPLVEQRRLKKKQRKADAQELLHSKGKPCGRSSCSLAVCVEALAMAAAASPASKPSASDRPNEPQIDPKRARRLQADRHRAGLSCGSEDCAILECVDGFANERKRRHRASRPCRSATCDNPICVSGRSAN